MEQYVTDRQEIKVLKENITIFSTVFITLIFIYISFNKSTDNDRKSNLIRPQPQLIQGHLDSQQFTQHYAFFSITFSFFHQDNLKTTWGPFPGFSLSTSSYFGYPYLLSQFLLPYSQVPNNTKLVPYFTFYFCHTFYTVVGVVE